MPRKRRLAIATTRTDLSLFILSDLKNELWMRGLVTTGNKSQLVARLEAALLTPPLTKKQKVKRASSSTPVNFAKMKIADLRKELRSKGLDTSGKKAELVDRLQGSVAGSALKEEPIEDEVMEETDFSKAKQASPPNSLVGDHPPQNAVAFKNEVEMKVADLARKLEPRRLDKSGKRVEFGTQHEGSIGRDALMKEQEVVEETDFSNAKKASPNVPVEHSKMKVADLRKELECKGLDTSGKKAELVDRLQGSVAGSALKEEPIEDEIMEETDFSNAKKASPNVPVDHSKMKVADLRKELECKGLDTSGKRAELVDRLQVSMAGSALKEDPIEDEVMEETDFSNAKKASPNVPVDHSKLKVADLRKELESKGLDTSGKKAELVNRLQGSVAGSALKEEPIEDEVMEETDFSNAKKASPNVPVDHSKLNVADLRKELESKGLDTSGKKAELVNRLQGSVAGSALKEEPIEDEVMEETDFSNAKKASPNVPVDHSKLKVADLKNELECKGLDTSGKRAELVDRLQGSVAGSALKEEPIEDEVMEETDFSNAKKASPNVPVDHSKMKVADLRKELESKGLDTSGKRAELVDRLQGGAAGGALKEGTDFSKSKRALKVGTPSKDRIKNQKMESQCHGEMEEYKDWHCMLNNIGNKFYTMQILKDKYRNVYKLWTRWGRVGKDGQSFEGPNTDLANAMMNFQKKFLEKTQNKWEDRKSFTPVSGKYTLIEDDDDEPKKMVPKLAAMGDPGSGSVPTSLPCTLDKSTQALIQLIFNTDMFNNALKSMDLDTKKMLPEKLNREQISKGIEALEAIETAMDACQNKSVLAMLTSNFYTIIPHDLGHRPPPIIVDRDMLQNKFDMLAVLGDIEIAQSLQQDKVKAVAGEPHELDVQYLYMALNINLELLNYTSHEYQVISKYIMSTAHPGMQLLDVWKVNRHGVNDRFKEHDAIDNRRLLWQGPNIAAVAATLKYGLRIMPHSGGCVGRGIYLASEHSMSIFYMNPARDGTGIMFLNEAALGKEYHITVDDFSLTAPPTDYDCVIAKGRMEPDPRYDTILMLDGKKVALPQGKSIPTSSSSSRFYQSEYVIYKESQTRIRYMIKIKF